MKYKLLLLLFFLPILICGQSIVPHRLKKITTTLNFNDPSTLSEEYLGDTIKGVVNYSKSRNLLNQPLVMQGSIFKCKSNFNGIIFKNGINFWQSIFKKKADFEDCVFETYLLGWTNYFNDTLNFRGSNFRADVNLRGSEFKKNLIFSDCIFEGNLDLSYLKTTDKFGIDFSGAVLPDTIYFSHNDNLPAVINFEKSHIAFLDRKRKVAIDLVGTDISKLRIDYINYKLFFDRRMAYVESDEEKETTYLQLLKNFKDNNQAESFKLLDIEYQFFRFDKLGLHWVGEFFYYWWEFGYAKEKVFLWIYRLLLLFTCLDLIFINFLNRCVYKMDNVPKIKSLKYFFQLQNRAIVRRAKKIHHVKPTLFFFWKQIRRRVWFSFVYTISVFFRITLKIEKMKFERWLGCIYLMIIYTSGLFSLAYLANYVLNK